MKRAVLAFTAGAVAGGLIGGITGYLFGQDDHWMSERGGSA